MDGLCSLILKFSPSSKSVSSSLPLKSPDDVLVLSHSWVLRVEMGVTQERLVLAVDSLLDTGIWIPLGGPAYPHCFSCCPAEF